MGEAAGLNPEKRLTNTSARKYLCQKLLDSNIPDTQAVHVTGHKNPASLNNYRALSNHQQQNMSTILSRSTNVNTSSSKSTLTSSATCSSSSVSDSSYEYSQNIISRNPTHSIFQNTTIHVGSFNIVINNNYQHKRKRSQDSDEE